MRVKHLFLALLLFFADHSIAQKTVLWKISRAGNPHISWLLGTFHTLGESFIDSFPIIKAKLVSSDLLVTEAPVDRQTIIDATNARPTSDTLTQMVSPEDLQLIKKIYQKSHLDLFKLTPGELLVQLNIYYFEYGCYPRSVDDKYTCDEYIQLLAKQNNKPAFYFESDSLQTDLLKQQSAYIDWKYFKRTVGAILRLYRGKPTAAFCKPVWNYLAFDIDYDLDKNCKDVAVVANRNAIWMKVLPAELDQHGCFIDVGMQHLCNTCGLIAGLKGLGYTVEPVPMQ